MPETYWKNGKDWCRCHGTRPKYCPGEDVTTYSSGGKDWCTCCGERPYRCKNSKTVNHMESPTVLLGEDLPSLHWATHGDSDDLLFAKHFIISSKKYF
jgi:hypothetical protein